MKTIRVSDQIYSYSRLLVFGDELDNEFGNFLGTNIVKRRTQSALVEPVLEDLLLLWRVVVP
jgi:hypothetical protein